MNNQCPIARIVSALLTSMTMKAHLCLLSLWHSMSSARVTTRLHAHGLEALGMKNEAVVCLAESDQQ